jgi:hypothetical protein
MASTITTRLMISGTAVTSDPININYTLSSTVMAPAIESASVGVDSSGIDIATGSASPSTRTFVYVKNTGTVAQTTPILVSLTGAASAMILLRGEFLYIPIAVGQVVNLSCSAEFTSQAEYGFFSA